ncbi:MAG: hypothetical protein C0490_16730, partial [Marivirga sp.]|nr:hypothetical protein [Marivirga sp.]
TGSKPILVLLPGIMGSNLAQRKKLVWIDYRRFLLGELRKLDINSADIDAPSLIKTSYGKMVKYMSAAYDVVTFPFDWRLQLATRAKLFSEKIEELLKFNQPIKIIGHSMGGVLVRDFIVYHPKTWEKLNHSTGFKLIFLGAPLGGSYRIPSVLFGLDGIIDKLSKIDIFHSKKDLLKIFSKLPGILSLLPHTREQDFADPATWQTMKNAFGVTDWPLPESADLAEFGNYRDKIQERLEEIDYTNVTYIAGRDKATPCGYRIDETKSGKELVFLSTAEGDQSVTWESGIPSRMIKENAVYYSDVTHGALANEPDLFDGICEILSNGSTSLLSKTRPIVRGDKKLFRSPEIFDFDLSPEGVENSILGLEPKEKQKETQIQLRLSVSNGDLKYATYPVLAGHFNNDGILYAERIINFYLKGALSERHRLGLYPGAIGTNEVILSSSQDGDFKGAIIIGLGDFGSLTAFELTKSVEQGTCRYLIQLNTGPLSSPVPNGISSLIIGCGYGGLSIEGSVNAIALGVSNANGKIKKLYGERAKLINEIEFVEQDKSKSLNCFYSLHKMGKNRDGAFQCILKKVIVEKPGLVESSAIDSTVGWWTRITVQRPEKDLCENKTQDLLFNISTGGAREEQRALKTSKHIIEELVAEISTENNWSESKAKTIFELLIPNDFK